MIDNIDILLETAIKASLEAGKRIMEIYNSEDFEIEYKNDNSPLTKADIAAHQIIQERLEQTSIPVLSEEGKEIPYKDRVQWNKLWIVDPIDGTKEFIKRNGEFTVNIALIENQIPILGVIYVPVLKELYFAHKQSGSFKITNIDYTTPIAKLVAEGLKLPILTERKEFTVVASRSHLSEETIVFISELEEIHGSIKSISKGSSLKLCMVAEGLADCYPRFAPTMEWDTAAGHAICKYAGFELIDFETKAEMLYNRADLLNNWFIVKKNSQ
jgi:3'(2'), 5'-bisphosphate nucleotidase